MERVSFLRSLPSIRQTCERVHELAKIDQTKYFRLQSSELDAVASYIIKVINQTYSSCDEVPFHSRWRHFEAGSPQRIPNMTAQWNCDSIERARRLIDLVVVSVLLDAGAGAQWYFFEKETQTSYTRSEGLGIASLHMFMAGVFSSDPSKPHRVDAQGLCNLTIESLRVGFQVGDDNLLVGLEGRLALLQRLGIALKNKPGYFKSQTTDTLFRPGNMIDSLGTSELVSVSVLWTIVIEGFEAIWPESRTKIDGINMGDVWPLSYLNGDSVENSYVSFHKLSQWLTYSLIEPLQWAGVNLTDLNLLTALPEYRNGGLLLDTNVLVPRNPSILNQEHEPSSEIVIEWRALTVAILDDVHKILLERLHVSADEFPLAKMLEGGSWKAGRLIAKERRHDGGPPIRIKSDGTVF
ncbi:unnamed protein product [Albugo candida]|uniref:DUF1688-domain-containing protein n=1 Tax=Albugo candida TaxID=65357 RepID=A0A024GGJ8_9STRA|nr:unnamed protein product [Albugo candida]|eukprot:CCI45879.1 unnamed protein product [Albugo candida]